MCQPHDEQLVPNLVREPETCGCSIIHQQDIWAGFHFSPEGDDGTGPRQTDRDWGTSHSQFFDSGHRILRNRSRQLYERRKEDGQTENAQSKSSKSSISANLSDYPNHLRCNKTSETSTSLSMNSVPPAAFPATEPSDTNPIACRICLSDDRQSQLLTPCRCSGSARYVHRECLDVWRHHSPNPLSKVRCDICKAFYRFRNRSMFFDRWVTLSLSSAHVICWFVYLCHGMFVLYATGYLAVLINPISLPLTPLVSRLLYVIPGLWIMGSYRHMWTARTDARDDERHNDGTMGNGATQDAFSLRATLMTMRLLFINLKYPVVFNSIALLSAAFTVLAGLAPLASREIQVCTRAAELLWCVVVGVGCINYIVDLRTTVVIVAPKLLILLVDMNHSPVDVLQSRATGDPNLFAVDRD
ncbi:hypothetical protein BJ742DRAFT_816718 [Cladochytrium replicatum]|nr:hypothetical protein BJ742DRAFT_816718 [Cladochytrium replicatum]